MVSRRTKQNQRNCSHHPKSNQPKRTPKTSRPKLNTTGQHQKKLNQSNWQQKPRLKSKRVQSRNLATDFVFSQTINTKRPSQDQSNPWRPAIVERQNNNSNKSNPNSKPLPKTQTLTKKNNSQHNRDQRVYEISQRRLHHMTRRYPDHISLPIHHDENSRNQNPYQRRPRRKNRTNRTPRTISGNQNNSSQKTKDHPPNNHLHSRSKRKQRDDDRKRAPNQISTKPIAKAFGCVGFAHSTTLCLMGS